MTANAPTARLAALSLPAVVGAAQVLLPAGTFDAPRGALLGVGPWRLSEDDGAALAARLAERHADLAIDYEHQTLRAADNGQPAPAAGWIAPADILWRPGVGLVATAVRWSERAAAWIAGGEYRYLSPVFRYAQDGRVQDLLHVALTNNPALDLLPEVALAAASLSRLPPETPMDFRPLLTPLLGLPDTATDEEVQAGLESLQAQLADAKMADGTAAASLLLYMREAGSRVAALSAQLAATPPTGLIAELQGQVAALTQAAADRRKQEVMTAALADGRLMAGSQLHAHAQTLALPALEALTASLAPIAALTGTQTGGHAPAGDAVAALSAEEVAICQSMGMTHDRYRKARATDQETC